MIKLNNVHFQKGLKTKEDVFKLIAKAVAKEDHEFYNQIIKGLNKREEEVSTGFEDGFAIPHARVEGITKPILSVVKVEGINWPSMDGKDTTFIICILVPESKEEEHLKILSNLTRKLVDENYRNALKVASKEEIVELISTGEAKTLVDSAMSSSTKKGKYLAVTKCPVGIAHTYMAAENLEKAAKEMGVDIKVEAQGSAGVENKITKEDLENCLGVIIAADATIEGKGRFFGKKVLEVAIKPALENPQGLLKDVENAPIMQGEAQEEVTENVTLIKAVMNGVSHMIPFVVFGGLLIALSLSLGGEPTADGLAIPEGTIWYQLNQIGAIGFSLMIPILAGYIAYAMAGRAALAPAMIGATVANSPDILGTDAGTGFLGALAVGIMAGYLVQWINSFKVKKELRPIMPIFVIPIVATLIISFVFIFILAKPIGLLMFGLNLFLTYLSSNPALTVFLGMALGAMVAADMGGPINKVAFLFGVASISSGHPEIMGSVAAAIAVPPLSMGVATLIRPKKFTEEEKGAGIAALLMGLIGITEGAIPFAAGDPKRVIPAIMTGSMVSSTLALFFGVTNMVPHGGPIVGILGATTNTLLYFVAILIGTIVAAIVAVSLKEEVK